MMEVLEFSGSVYCPKCGHRKMTSPTYILGTAFVRTVDGSYRTTISSQPVYEYLVVECRCGYQQLMKTKDSP